MGILDHFWKLHRKTVSAFSGSALAEEGKVVSTILGSVHEKEGSELKFIRHFASFETG
jgi:hypothetical protein